MALFSAAKLGYKRGHSTKICRCAFLHTSVLCGKKLTSHLKSKKFLSLSIHCHIVSPHLTRMPPSSFCTGPNRQLALICWGGGKPFLWSLSSPGPIYRLSQEVYTNCETKVPLGNGLSRNADLGTASGIGSAVLSFLMVWIKAHLTCANFQELPRRRTGAVL